MRKIIRDYTDNPMEIDVEFEDGRKIKVKVGLLLENDLIYPEMSKTGTVGIGDLYAKFIINGNVYDYINGGLTGMTQKDIAEVLANALDGCIQTECLLQDEDDIII